MKRSALFFLIVFSGQALAQEVARITATIGDQTTEFVVVGVPGDLSGTLSSGGRPTYKKKVSDTDLAFIKGRVREALELREARRPCHRRAIEAQALGQTVRACADGRSPASVKLVGLMNGVVAVFQRGSPR